MEKFIKIKYLNKEDERKRKIGKKLTKCRICNKRINYIYELNKNNKYTKESKENSLNKNICIDCYNKYDSSFDKNKYVGRICVLICPDCNRIFLSGGSTFFILVQITF